MPTAEVAFPGQQNSFRGRKPRRGFGRAVSIDVPALRCLKPSSLPDDDARHRMNLEPLGVFHVLDPRPGNRNVGTNWRDCNSAVKPLAGGFGVSLCDGKHANGLEHEIAAFVRFVSTV